MFALIENLLCGSVKVVMLIIVRPSECNHLARHVAFFEYELLRY